MRNKHTKKHTIKVPIYSIPLYEDDNNQLFVSTYMLHLPDKRKLQEFMLKEMEKMGI